MGSEMYKAFPDPDVLLPHLIKDIPTLPVVNSQRIKINVDTAGEMMAFQHNRCPVHLLFHCELEPVVLLLFVLGGFEWISTGLYLSPGMKTNLTLPAAIVNKGWKVPDC